MADEADPKTSVAAAKPAPSEKPARAAKPPRAASPDPYDGKEPHEEAVVRRGTIVIGDHDDATHVGPGGKVRLPKSEVAKLRARGILHPAEGQDIMVEAGPKMVGANLPDPK